MQIGFSMIAHLKCEMLTNRQYHTHTQTHTHMHNLVIDEVCFKFNVRFMEQLHLTLYGSAKVHFVCIFLG